MPYNWTRPQAGAERELHLWPHQSLPPKGYVRFIGLTAALICVPLVPLLGSFLLFSVFTYTAMMDRKVYALPLELLRSFSRKKRLRIDERKSWRGP